MSAADERVAIRLSADEPEALYLGGVWVSPGTVALVPKDDARKLIKAGRAEEAADA